MWWIIGLAIPLVAGYVVMPAVKSFLRALIKPPKEIPEFIPGSVTGTLERLFFTLLVAFDVPGSGTAIIAWLALKLASGWNSGERKSKTGTKEWVDAVNAAFVALLAGLASMLLAVIGGLIIRELG